VKIVAITNGSLTFHTRHINLYLLEM